MFVLEYLKKFKLPNEDKVVIRIFCLIDDLLQKIGRIRDVRKKWAIVSTAIISVLYFDEYLDKAGALFRWQSFVRIWWIKADIADGCII